MNLNVQIINMMNKSYIKQLPNASTLIIGKHFGYNSIVFGIGVRSGSANDPFNKKGLTHCCEHMLVRLTNNQIESQIVYKLRISAFTEKEETFFIIQTLKEYCNILLEWINIFFSVINNITKSIDDYEKHFEKEKQVILEEIYSISNSNIEKIDNAFFKHAFSTSGIGEPVYGYAEDVNNLTLIDFQEYIRDIFVPSNIIIACCGDIDISKVDPTVSEILLNLKDYQIQAISPKDNLLFNPGVLNICSDLEFCYFIKGYHTVKRNDENRKYIYAISNYLGEGTSSQFFKIIRENEGLVYQLDSEYHLFSESGIFVIKGLVQQNNLARVIQSIDEIIHQIQNKNFNTNEIEQIKNSLRFNLLINLDNLSNQVLRYLKHEMWFRYFYTLEDDMNFINSINASTLKLITSELFESEALLCYNI